MFINFDLLLKELEYQKNLIKKFEQELLVLPIGSLSIKKINNNKYIYYQVKNKIEKDTKTKKKTGIELANFDKESTSKDIQEFEQKRIMKCLSKNDTDLAIKVSRKKYIKTCLPILKNNIKILESFNEKYIPYDADQVWKLMPEAYLFVKEKYIFGIVEKIENTKNTYLRNIYNADWLTNNNDENSEWESLIEQKNNFYFESLKHVTSTGLAVRSKSEAIIAELLDANGLKYKYETKLNAKDKCFSPDFAILRADDNKIIYWEHFGMINNEEYIKKMFYKINEYQKAEIILWDNLVITCDSEDGNIDARQIIRIIKKILL